MFCEWPAFWHQCVALWFPKCSQIKGIKKLKKLRKPKQRPPLCGRHVCPVVTGLSLFFCAQALGKYRCMEKETDMLLSTLSAMQEKAQHLEYNLSAETRIKLDLFSALGDARRQLEIAQGCSLNESLLHCLLYFSECHLV